jgi:hypothetical protein
MSDDNTTYPWAMLYNLESQRGERRVRESRRVGRPRNPIPRTQTSIMMTAEEKRILRELTYSLQEKFIPATVSRSQIIGLGLHVVKALMDEIILPDDVNDWPSLVVALTGKLRG